jgi:fatty-acyl-CoA synthase
MPNREGSCQLGDDVVPSLFKNLLQKALGDPLPPDTPGALCCRGYGVMQGYYKKSEETAQAIDNQWC